MTTEAKAKVEVKESLKDQLIGLGVVAGLTEEQKKAALAAFKAEIPDSKAKTLPLSKLFESEDNLRKVFDGIPELAASMGNGMGVLVPLLVRPHANGRFEIVAGARRFRAAQKAGLKEVPVDVRDLTDSQVAEVMLVENSQRQGLHPLEEAEGYDRLERDFHYTRIQIAKKVGKSTGTVHSRMKLLALGPEARKAFRDDKFDATVAVPLARIRDHRLQAKALPVIAGMSSRTAIDWLQNQYTQTLKSAPFDLNDPDLLPAAGSCKKCPDRSGGSPGLFEDIKGHDTCTNPPCFEKKVKAAWEIASAGAEAKGMMVLGIAKGRTIFGSSDEPAHSSGFVLANKVCGSDPSKRTWKQIASLAKEPVVRFFIPDARLKGRECFKEEDVLATISAKWAKEELDSPTRSDPGAMIDFDKARHEALVRKAVVRDFIGVTAAKVGEIALPELRIMALAVHRSSSAQSADERRELTEATAEKWISTEADAIGLFRYIYEGLLDELIGAVYNGYGEDFELLSRRSEYDVKAAEKRLGAILEAEALMKAAPAKAD